MIKFLVIAVALFIAWKLFSGDKQKKQEQAAKNQQKMASTGEMIKDPVCGTYVKKDSGIRVKNGDKVFCFCSYECRDKYLKSIGAEIPGEKIESEEKEKEKEEA
ncbi:transcriptional regulator [Maridesulfovibrio bastinii]|uniref:transcriptional regulator n=1 Tax=Maridesulfovibrio bastinii TaxID=47157 RepID=UPI0003FD84CA|nr:transcriptional regulator [Maridesulfovibrio bastinii]